MYLAVDQCTDVFHIDLDTLQDILRRLFLVHLISQRVAHRNSRREIRAEISVHDHHFGSDFMGIVDSQFTRFDRIVGKVYRYQYLLFLMTGFFLLFGILAKPFTVFDDTQGMRQIAFFNSHTYTSRNYRLDLVHIVYVNFNPLCFKHRFENLSFLKRVNR